MSVVNIKLDYDERLWTSEEESTSSTYRWKNYELTLENGASIQLDVEITRKQKKILFEALTKPVQPNMSHWQDVPATVQNLVLKIEQQLRDGAAYADKRLRFVGGALRLPPWSFSRQPTNSNHRWASVYWSFNEQDLQHLAPLIDQLEEKQRLIYSKGIWIPLPDAYEGRDVMFTKEQRDEAGDLLSETIDIPPSYALFASALDQWENRNFGSAIAILAVSLETALKWHLTKQGDAIAGYLIENIQSPPLPNLLSCARTHADLNIPKKYQGWLATLVKARNEIVHKPVEKDLKPLEVGRWFATGEAILKALMGINPDDNIGEFVDISSNIEVFPAGTKGVVLRREETYSEDSFHILLDSGITRRFSLEAFTVVKE
ncbi:hypothetical protein BOW37_01650 [Solemya velum gill symbiont]|uniref:hypothetical protein n=1 Tax=Solemya velum gill symbiont TaxID=2340 RepID=UPI000995FB15|nr:hypothetical protein [Solemya velum gill symbiont]OOZ45822.1 hypothetical protein BOW37_01650 [Solemya velum gill symbiont]